MRHLNGYPLSVCFTGLRFKRVRVSVDKKRRQVYSFHIPSGEHRGDRIFRWSPRRITLCYEEFTRGGEGTFTRKLFSMIPFERMVQRMLELRLFNADRSAACNFSAWNPHRSCSPACERFINRKLYENPNRPLFKRADGTNYAFSMLEAVA